MASQLAQRASHFSLAQSNRPRPSIDKQPFMTNISSRCLHDCRRLIYSTYWSILDLLRSMLIQVIIDMVRSSHNISDASS